MAEVDVTNKRIFYRSNDPYMLCKKRRTRIFGKFYRKTHVQEPIFKRSLWLQVSNFFSKEAHVQVFFSEKCLKLFKPAFLQYTCESLPLVNLNKISEKTTLKKPSLIRVKSRGFYRSLLQKKFISFSLRKTFSLKPVT